MIKTIRYLSAVFCFLIANAAGPLPGAEEEPLARILAIAHRTKDPYDRLQTLLDVASAYIECKDLYSAKNILSKIVQCASGIKNTDSRAVFLAELTAKYTDIGENDTALEIARHIPFPDSRSDAMVRIIDDCIKKGEYARAFQITERITDPYSKAIALFMAIKSARGRYPEVIRGAGKIMGGSSAETRNLVRVISVGELAKFESKPAAHFSVSEDLTERYQKLIRLAEKHIDAQSYDLARRILVLAKHIVKDFKSPISRNATLGRIAVDYAKIRDFEKAVELTQELDADEVKVWALSRIIINYYEVGKDGEASLLLASVGPPKVKDLVCCSIAEECARRAEFKKAIEAAGMIREGPVKLKAVLAVAKNMHGRNDVSLETEGLLIESVSLLDKSYVQ